MLKITFELRPDESLTAQQLQEIVDRARAAGLTPEQWVKRIVMDRVKEPGIGQPMTPNTRPTAA